jgi:hypothetical protein
MFSIRGFIDGFSVENLMKLNWWELLLLHIFGILLTTAFLAAAIYAF